MKENQPLQLSFRASLKVDLQGSRITSDGGLILVREEEPRAWSGADLSAAINRDLIAKAGTIGSPQRIARDMDSTEIPVYGQQENSAYNGHFQSTCYHPLLLFNREALENRGVKYAIRIPAGGRLVKHAGTTG